MKAAEKIKLYIAKSRTSGKFIYWPPKAPNHPNTVSPIIIARNAIMLHLFSANLKTTKKRVPNELKNIM